MATISTELWKSAAKDTQKIPASCPSLRISIFSLLKADVTSVVNGDLIAVILASENVIHSFSTRIPCVLSRAISHIKIAVIPVQKFVGKFVGIVWLRSLGCLYLVDIFRNR